MLFRYSTELATSYMPESFLKIIISKYHYPPLNNCTELGFLYPSKECWDNDLNIVDKDRYFVFLSSQPECMATVITIMRALLESNENVAILTSNEEVQQRFARYFCDFITERYGYTSFPFRSMDDITIEMRKLSCTTEDGDQQLVQDLSLFS